MKIKEKILKSALDLYNNQGFSNVSIRQIAADLDISHSNLIYHFKTKQEIAEALHQQLLNHAIGLNEQTKSPDLSFTEMLFESTKQGFTILYNYRFLMIELNYILRENENLRQLFLQVESVRSKMYRDSIKAAVEKGYMRNELYINEYNDFIEQIKIFSDSWISSSEIYDGKNVQVIIEKYSMLFVKLFFPYFTEKGREEVPESIFPEINNPDKF